MTEAPTRSLRVLVVEDEFLIAAEMAAILEEAGHHVVGPAGSVSAGQALLAKTGDLDAAVIDANLRGETSAPLAAIMRERKIPFCVCTGYRVSDLKSLFGDVMTLHKPIDPPGLLRAVAALASK